MIYPKSLVLHPPIHTQVETGRIITCLKNNQANSPILDFGAGTGRLTIPLLQAGFKVDVVEPDLKSANILKGVIRELNYKIKIYSQIPNRKYSAIVGTDVLHHVDINTYLQVFYRHLKPHGLICFSEPNSLNPFWYIQPQMFLFWDLEKGLIQINRRSLLTKLKNLNFQSVDIRGMGLFPRPFFAFNTGLSRITDRLGDLKYLQNHAYRLLITAQK